MIGEARPFAIRGTTMHTPAVGELEIIEDAMIVVDEAGTITAVHRPGEPGHGVTGSHASLDLDPGQYLLPGLVDLHVHAPQWPQLGNALHLPLEDWLQRYTFPLEAKFADIVFAERIYASLVDALLANGTTTAVYFATVHLDATVRLAEICLEKGQRSLVGKVAMDDTEQCPDYYRDQSANAALDGTFALIDHVRALPGNGGGLVRPAVTPRFVPSCSDALLEGLGEAARRTGCHVQTHCSESDWQHGYVLARHGRSDSESLESFGLLTRHSILAHSNFIGDGDMDRFVRAGAGVAHCPLSNFYLSNAVFPLRAALKRGLRVGLGTDIAGGHSPSILDSCRLAVAASRALEEGVDPRRHSAERGRPDSRIDIKDAFWLATAGGGEVLDLPIGTFAVGQAFDAILVDTTVADSNLIVWHGLDTLEDVFQNIIYNAARNNIRKTWVQGRLVVDKVAR